MKQVSLGEVTKIQTGKIDVNKAVAGGKYPFFTCSREVYEIDDAPYEGKAVLVAGNGDLNVKYYEGKFNAYQRTYFLFVNDENVLLPKFLYWFLESYVEKLRSESIGSTIKYIKMGNLTDASFTLPSLEIQIQIVEKLDKAFAEIDSLEKNLQLKEEKTNQLLQSMLSAAFTNTEEFDMKVVKLGEICELISRGISPTYCDNSDLIVINQRCIRNNDLDLTFSKFHNENSKKVNETKYLKYGDGLINSTGVGTLGRTAIFLIDNNLKYTVDSHVTIARPKLEQIDSGYFKLMLKSLETKFVELSTGTSGQTELPRENLNNIEVVICEKKEDQKKLANKILSSFVEIEKLKGQILIEKERVSSLRQSILSNAFKFEEKAA